MLAEDYVITRMFHAAGFEVRLSPTVVRNVCRDTTISAFLRRNLRWGLMRSRLTPLGYFCEALSPGASGQVHLNRAPSLVGAASAS